MSGAFFYRSWNVPAGARPVWP